MSCPAYWNRRVKYELLPAFPLVKFIQARAYGRPMVLDAGTVPAVDPAPGDPVKQIIKFLKANPPPEIQDGLIIMYHRAGGFSHIVNVSSLL